MNKPKLWIITIMFSVPGSMIKLVYNDEVAAKAVKNQLDEALASYIETLGAFKDSVQKVRDNFGASLSVRMRDVMAINLSDLEAEFAGLIEFQLRQDEANRKAQASAQNRGPGIVRPIDGGPRFPNN